MERKLSVGFFLFWRLIGVFLLIIYFLILFYLSYICNYVIIENYASGISRIYSEYANEELKLSIESSMVMLKLTLPNINY